MPTINGITVRISDGVKTADYAPPKLYDLTANFTPEGQGETVTAEARAVLVMLQRLGDEYLGRSGAPIPEIAPPIVAPSADIVRPAAEVEKTRKAAAKAKADATIELPGTKAADATIAPPSVLDEPDVKAHAEENKAKATVVTQDDLSDLVSTPEISDAALNTAVTRRLKELGATGPNLVRALKDSYNPEPDKRVLQIRELDQGQRTTFLARLDKLSPAMSPEEAAAVEA